MNERSLSLVWLLLFAAGTAIPLAAFLPWVATNGLPPDRFLAEAFANRVAAFFALDVILSALAVLVAAWVWLGPARAALVTLATLAVGVSSGLPLLLLLATRDRQRAQSN